MSTPLQSFFDRYPTPTDIPGTIGFVLCIIILAIGAYRMWKVTR